MEQPISRRQHAFTDYSYIPAVAAAPTLFGFEDEPDAVLMTRVLAGGILLSSVFTRAEWGLIREMPYKGHLAVDFLGGVVSLAAPWLCGFSHNKRARNTFLAMGVAGLSAALLSRPEEMPEHDGRRR